MDNLHFFKKMIFKIDQAMAQTIKLQKDHPDDTVMTLMIQLLAIREALEAQALERDPLFDPLRPPPLPVGS